MNKVEIVAKLREYNKEVNHIFIDELIKDLNKDIQNEGFIKSTGDKGKLNAIKRVIGNKKNSHRPALQTYTVFNGKSVFTDSYQAYMLNDTYLPNYEISYFNEENKKEVEEVAKQHGIKISGYTYPNVKVFIDRCYDTSIEYKTMGVNLKDILLEIKTNPEKIVTFKDEEGKEVITISTELLKNAIDILKLKDDFTFKYTGMYEPAYIENNGEIALLLPIRKN